ncbi:MAG: ClpXP protease specificity-enhancing factor [Candidatus Rariloculaceae bacterium]
MTQATSKRPYLIRAMHEWMTDNNLTPYIVLDASDDNLDVPDQYISEGKLILNISYAATQNLVLGDDSLIFSTRFEGVSRQIDLPTTAVIGIYAQETGQGMIFSEDDATPPPDEAGPGDGEPTGRPTLKVVK